jgi:PmbA protein
MDEILKQAEVFTIVREETPVLFEANRLKMIETRQSRGVAVRVVHAGRLGLASATHADDAADLVAAALEAAAYGPPARFELPPSNNAPDVPVYDPAVNELALEDLIALGTRVIDRVRAAFPDVQVDGAITRTIATIELQNSRGGHWRYRKSLFAVRFEGLRVRGTDMLFVGDSEVSCRPIQTVDTIADQMLRQLEWARELAESQTGTLPVLFTPSAAQATLLAPIEMALNGRTVLQGASPLEHKRGQQVFDPRFSLWDDPTMPFVPGSAPIDDEGVPSRRNLLVQEGVVGDFLYDLQTAAEAGRESTGSAVRSVELPPAPATRCLFVAPGETPLADLIAAMPDGLIAEQFIGAGQGNTLGGDFGGNVLLGYRVKNGEVIGRVKDTVISGNAYQALATLGGLSQETRWFGGRICAPYFLIDAVTVASKG